MDLRGKVETADTSKLQLCDISLDVKLCFNQNYGSLVVCLIFCGRNAKKYTKLLVIFTLCSQFLLIIRKKDLSYFRRCNISNTHRHQKLICK